MWIIHTDLLYISQYQESQTDLLSKWGIVAIVYSLSHAWLLQPPWTAAQQVFLSIGFPRQEYWSRLPFPSPGDLPDPALEPTSPVLAGRFLTTEPPGKPHFQHFKLQK